MFVRIDTLRYQALSFVGALFFAAVLVGTAAPIVPLA